MYFSEAKAAQFVDRKPRRFRRTTSGELSIGPGKLSVTAERAPEGAAAKITKISRHLDRVAKPFDERSVCAGDWVTFNAHLAMALVSSPPHRMLFLGPSPDHPVDVALLLFGSPRHRVSPPRDEAVVGVEDLDSYTESLISMIKTVATADGHPLPSNFRDGAVSMAERIHMDVPSYPRMAGYAQVVDSFACADRIFLGDHPARFSPRKLVVASPLFVEHAN
ncbi:SAVMC3_10250 family protein [Streptodolium elevatio]|uniref:SAVMC3_10250 family protein n=1 Tax=Streptodolium elevatio TaxID=3157996 RepID=A0ABV3DR47_9ACTN